MKEFIYELIPKDRYITRSELVELTKLSDRQVRDFISAIKQEHTIISSSRNKGYRRTRSSEEMTTDEMIEEILSDKRKRGRPKKEETSEKTE